MKKSIIFSLLIALTLIGCTKKSQEGSSFAGRALSPQPAPQNMDSVETLLSRYRGQNRFLTAEETSYHGPMLAMAESAPSTAKSLAPDNKREMQESDIFKIGKPGSKLLFLLNNYRGLQIVDFSDGADKPKLVGRVPATGNYPQDMYYDTQNDTILVVEQSYAEGEGTKSRILVYDVSQPAKPAIINTVEFAGNLVDSRLVGDVLYTVGTVYPANHYYTAQERKAKGFVHSFKVGKKIESIQEYTLALPSVYGNLMNIVEVEVDGAMKYYLLAILSESAWSWWDRQSLVEVVDISSSKGTVLPVMTVSAKGQIRERSQTLIQNGTLLVTSNYQIPGTTQFGRIGRIAVETFALPTAQSEVLSEQEAQYRQMHINRELAKNTGDEESKAEQLKALLADATLGLKGRFVTVAGEGSLRKMTADSVVTVGDTSGQSANLQDVRYANGLLYAFWVPRNQIDPLEIFDISDLSKGVKHVAHTEIPGWIEHATPLEYKGRKFILAQGWIVPAIDNEQNRRYPQAVLFEVKSQNGKLKAVEVSQLSLEQKNLWVNFNAPDKFIETKFSSESAGEILFSISSYADNKYTQGGKIISFNLEAAVTGEGDVFTEGGLLVGELGWLRRVFTNSEIDRVNSFSDQQLSVFDTKDLTKVSGSVSAVATLELARNIRAYATMATRPELGLFGVQVISDYSYYYGYDEREVNTELRKVSASQADAEVSAVSGRLTLKGAFADMKKLSNGSLLIATETQKVTKSEQPQSNNGHVWYPREYSTIYRLYNVTSESFSSPTALSVVEWEVKNVYTATPWRLLSASQRYGGQISIEAAPNGDVYVQDSGAIRAVTVTGALSIHEITLQNCEANREDRGLVFLGGKAYLFSKISVEDEKHEGLRYSRNFLAEAKLSGNTLTCGEDRNIPGEPVTVTGNHLVVKDRWAREIQRNETSVDANNPAVVRYEVITDTGLTVLKLSHAEAVLSDNREDSSKFDSLSLYLASSDELLYLRSEAGHPNKYFMGGMMERSFWPGYNTPNSLTLASIRVDGEGMLTEEAYELNLEIGSDNAKISSSVDEGVRTLLVISNWEGTQIVSKPTSGRPAVLKLKRVSDSEETLTVIPGGFYATEDSVNYTGELRSFEFARGLAGVEQVYLAK